MKPDLRKRLLNHFAGLAADAESVGEKNVFLPVSEHGRALRPEIVVIEGGRGAGKSELFRALKNFGDDLGRLYGLELPAAKWVDAFSTSVDHPTVPELDDQASRLSDTELRNWWLHRLAVRLATAMDSSVTPPREADVTSDSAFIDSVEQYFAKRRSFVFAAYDSLDQIGPLDPTIRRRYVKALLSLWLSLSARYTWVRAKIFLRPDLFSDGQSDFPDASKLRARSQSLQWNSDDLFRLVVRHLANRPSLDVARTWIQNEARVSLAEGPFGWMPEHFTETQRISFSEALAGSTMGTGSRKGYTYRWITNHLQDGGGRIAPRSILRLMGFAAQGALSNVGGEQTSALMAPQDLQGALEATSIQRARELIEEHPLVNRLQSWRGEHLLVERKTAERLLSRPGPMEPGAAVITDGAVALNELERLGVVSVRADGRIDVPDIFRSGFGIKRKGGTRRAH